MRKTFNSFVRFRSNFDLNYGLQLQNALVYGLNASRHRHPLPADDTSAHSLFLFKIQVSKDSQQPGQLVPLLNEEAASMD
jgi:hypothetical protein